MSNANAIELFPSLPLSEWQQTKDTLHLFLQIIGKIRLKTMPRRNHWWHVTLYVTSRGLTTGPIPQGNRVFEINLDFIVHKLFILDSEGGFETVKLYDGLSVAEFYKQVFLALARRDIQVKILAKPYENKSTIPFAQDYQHASYNPDQVARFWRILAQIDGVLKEFSGHFLGKCSPPQLFWHSFDLAVTRFNGKKGPEMKEANSVNKEAYSHEVISAGFWPGDDLLPEPAFYCYTYPLPEDLTKEALEPARAYWGTYRDSPMALLKYEDLRQERDPRQALLHFLETSYNAGAKKAGWTIDEFALPPLVAARKDA